MNTTPALPTPRNALTPAPSRQWVGAVLGMIVVGSMAAPWGVENIEAGFVESAPTMIPHGWAYAQFLSARNGNDIAALCMGGVGAAGAGALLGSLLLSAKLRGLALAMLGLMGLFDLFILTRQMPWGDLLATGPLRDGPLGWEWFIAHALAVTAMAAMVRGRLWNRGATARAALAAVALVTAGLSGLLLWDYMPIARDMASAADGGPGGRGVWFIRPACLALTTLAGAACGLVALRPARWTSLAARAFAPLGLVALVAAQPMYGILLSAAGSPWGEAPAAGQIAVAMEPFVLAMLLAMALLGLLVEGVGGLFSTPAADPTPDE